MDWKEAENKLNFLERLSGDKVVWIIVLFLSLISLVSIFSSTSQMATDKLNRLDIVRGQMGTIFGGLVVIIGLYNIRDMKIFKWFSKLGFLFSFVLLAMLALQIDTPVIKARPFNGAWRALIVAGFQIHVFEVVKVAMILYLAWAMETMKEGELKLVKALSGKEHFEWIDKPFWQEVIYIYAPILIVCVLVLKGGTSSALFIAMILFMTILIGGIPFKHILPMGLVGIALFLGCVGLYKATSESEHVMFERIGTALNRLDSTNNYEEVFLDHTQPAKTRQEAIDKLRQPYGAKIAIHEGGFIGKTAGQSTQKYVVPVIYEDYIFSFIIEEYGLLGGILVIILYISLLARGSLIVRNCEEDFAKIAVAGLCLLITGQGMFHIIINCDMGVLTGQTLPLVSHGTSSFLCFSVAFGVILSISRMSAKRIQAQAEQAEPLLRTTGDEIQDGMDIIDAYESNANVEDKLDALDALDQLEEMDL